MTRFIWQAAGAERHLFHYTRAESAEGLLETGVALVGPRSDFGRGFYATDLAPDAHGPAEIHATLLPGRPRLWNAVVVIAVEPDGRPFEQAVEHHWLIPEADRLALGDRIVGIATFDEGRAAWIYADELVAAPGSPPSGVRALAVGEPTAPSDAQVQTLEDEHAVARALLALLTEEQARLVRQPSLRAELGGARYPLSAGQLAQLTGAPEAQIRRWADLRLVRAQRSDGDARFWPVAAATAVVLAAAPQHAQLTAAEIARGEGLRAIALIAEALSVWSPGLDHARAARARRAAELLGGLAGPADHERHDIALPDLLHALSARLDSIRKRVAAHGTQAEPAGPPPPSEVDP
jgi:hypothetical protein